MTDIDDSPAYTFRREGHTKVIEYDLTKRQKQQVLGRKRPDVFLSHRRHVKGNTPQTSKNDSDVHMESAGESVVESEGSGEELELEGNDSDDSTSATSKQLPRAANGKLKTKRGRGERVMAPEECRAHLRRLFQNEATMCSLLFGRHGPLASLLPNGFCLASADMFFLDVIPVSPTCFRPPAKMGETLFEHPQNELLTKILHTSYRLRDLHLDLRAATTKEADIGAAKLRTLQSRFLETLVQLQVDVNSFMDSSKNPAPVRQGKLPPAGVKQGLEKKEGLFRKHMMVFLFLVPYLN
jgi:DNA-directed RNA polymerase I subunit RPA1